MSDRLDAIPAWVPKAFRDIVDVVGLKAALTLAKEQPGQRIYVPTRPAKEHWISKTIGADLAAKLAHRYGGTEIDIPLMASGNRAQRWAMVEKAIEDGHSVSEIIRLSGLSRRTVYRHKAHIDRTDSRQGRLF
ncbi:MAG: hypothetical protein KDJ68_13265 [Rhodobiaceae bacterium]|nr:hypothetical protein [Rhodobiaceae bacterium]